MNRQKNSYHLGTVLFCALSGLILIGVRVVFSTPIEIDGDSIGKWISATALGSGEDWANIEVSHHSLRWAILVPQALVSTLLPGRYENYFLLPIIFYSVFTVVGMIFIRNNLDREVQVAPLLLGVLITIDPISHVMASQLKTVSFGLFYFILAIASLATYVRTDGKGWLIAGAVLVFFSYGSHITYLLFIAGPLLFIVGHRRDYLGGLIFLLVLVGLMVFESLTAMLFLGTSGSDGGRLGHLMSGTTHQPVTTARGSGPSPVEMADLVARWRLIPKYNLAVACAFCCSSTLLLKKQIRREMPAVIWFCFYSGGVYALAVSVPIVSFDPLRLAIALHTRYLAPAFPLMTIFIVWVLGRYAGTKESRGKLILSAITIFVSLGFVSGSIAYRCESEISEGSYSEVVERSYCRIFRYTQNQNIYPAPDRFLFRAQNYYLDFSKDYRSGGVSLYGGIRNEILRDLIEFSGQPVRLVETPNGWFSIDGSDKELCVRDLGQVEKAAENYRLCGSQPMTKWIPN